MYLAGLTSQGEKMFEVIKEKIWNMLKEKEISLAMIYDREGKILWHKGREIEGKDVFAGEGFCKSYIEESLKNPVGIDVEDYIKSDIGRMSKSARQLMVRSVIIRPVKRVFFLYVDSGTKEFFNEKDRISLQILGELLEQIISKVRADSNVHGFTGVSQAGKKVQDLVVKYSLEEEPVLLTGETGVGKNHIAALIHRYSGRKGKFVIVDTPNIDANLFESKLFGHKKGAFTDAKFAKTGLVEEAKKGTLFLDEITEVPLFIQAKLLRFLDTRKFYTLGESTEKEADVRIIAATNKKLRAAVEEKEFRQDLYYRLNVLEIKIPPLRERKEDIEQLVLQNEILLRGKEIGPGFWDVFREYRWPGNVRELLNVLKRAGVILESPITGGKIFSLIHMDSKKISLDMGERGERAEDREIRDIREKITAGGSFWDLIWKPFINRDMNREMVKSILNQFFIENSSSFKKMIPHLHIEEEDYQKFMSLLYQYKIDPRK